MKWAGRSTRRPEGSKASYLHGSPVVEAVAVDVLGRPLALARRDEIPPCTHPHTRTEPTKHSDPPRTIRARLAGGRGGGSARTVGLEADPALELVPGAGLDVDLRRRWDQRRRLRRRRRRPPRRLLPHRRSTAACPRASTTLLLLPSETLAPPPPRLDRSNRSRRRRVEGEVGGC